MPQPLLFSATADTMYNSKKVVHTNGRISVIIASSQVSFVGEAEYATEDGRRKCVSFEVRSWRRTGRNEEAEDKSCLQS